ncbi:MAG: hypothetical protein IGS03_12815 [Candidatus Sericytochromatia bacterium]|nr:hypothetical protein [Candidatus Sericytochromatia bacterium]
MPSSRVLRPHKTPVFRDTLILLRLPFSLFLLPVYLLALNLSAQPDASTALALFVLLHGLVYPASNGYNSLVDRDTTPIGGLAAPPPPPALLGRVVWLMDLLALGWAGWLGGQTLLGVALFIAASRAYSAPWPRLKRLPWISFWLVALGQGSITFWTVWASLNPQAPWSLLTTFGALAAGALVGAAYPLSQIYQHAEDAERGDLTLSRLLGVRGTLLFSAGAFGLGGALLLALFGWRDSILLLMCSLPGLLAFVHFAWQTWQEPERVGHAGVMRVQVFNTLGLNLGLLILAGRAWLA